MDLTDLAVSLSIRSSEQGMENDDGLVQVPDEHALQVILRPRRRVVLPTTSTPTFPSS